MKAKTDHLADLKRTLGWLRGELERMPAFKVGTKWHTDRVREVEYLTGSIRRIEKHRAEMN